MLTETPHTLQRRVLYDAAVDAYGRQTGENNEDWVTVASCFCHDNSQMKQVSVNGELWTYQYHVVYEGERIAIGTKVRCVDSSCCVVGTGIVKKSAECYSSAFEGRCDLWLE